MTIVVWFGIIWTEFGLTESICRVVDIPDGKADWRTFICLGREWALRERHTSSPFLRTW